MFPQVFSAVDFTWGNKMIYERIVLHVYNHTLSTGQGYHFEALVPAANVVNRVQEGSAMRCARSTSSVQTAQGDAAEAATTGTETMGSVPVEWSNGGQPSCERVQKWLQDFFQHRGATITIA